MELQRLRRDLDQVQQEFNDTHAAQLLEANEQLVLNVLQAENLVETATHRLNELTHVAQRDALTNAPNRALMLDRLQTAIGMARRRQTHIAVLFVDIDRFKEINDTHGHAIGDEVLKRVARSLESAVRDSDTVSRHSGDEFVVLLSEISQASDAALIAEKMLAAIGASNTDLPDVTARASVGIAIFPQDGEDAATLIGRADEAMYESKRRGGGSFSFYGRDDTPASGQALDAGIPSGERGGAGRSRNTPHHRNLRYANEQMALSSLAAREAQAHASDARGAKILAMVAHELRKPLDPIRAAADLLGTARADEARHASLQQIIQRQAMNMARIIDVLLDGSRVLAGKFHLERVTVDLSEVLRLAIGSCRPAMEAKRQHLSIQLPPGRLPISGDMVRLTQVFQNLLDNATKYTPEGGGISITAVVLDHAVAVTVSDNGIGISPERLPDVFAMFVQEPRAVAARGHGLGIGLAVVHELVQAHGGSVAASSAGHGLGSEFVVTLPMADDQALQ